MTRPSASRRRCAPRSAARARSRPTATTVGEVLDDLVERYPALRAQLFAERRTSASFVNVYLGGEDVRTLDGPRDARRRRRDRDPPARHGRWHRRLTARTHRPRTPRSRPDRLDAARRAAAPVAEAVPSAVREARGPEPDRLDQGPRREGDDRQRRGDGRARARPPPARADEREHRASRSRSSRSCGATRSPA